MDPRWGTPWYNSEQSSNHQEGGSWDARGFDHNYAPPISQDPNSTEDLHQPGQLYGNLQSFTDPSTDMTTASYQQINQSTFPTSQSFSQTALATGVPLTGTFEGHRTAASPLGSLPNTPHLHPATQILPSSPFEQAQRLGGSYSSDSRRRAQYDAALAALPAGSKRRRSVEARKKKEDSQPPPELSEDENLLLKLKEEQNMPWKDISKEFEEKLGRPYQVPALQMRYKRLKERLRTWTDQDVAALEAAHAYWEANKFEIIAQKMVDFGVHDRWPAKLVERKWEETWGKAQRTTTLPSTGQFAITPSELLADSTSTGREPISLTADTAYPAGGGLYLGADPEWTTRIMERRPSGNEQSEAFR